jgi:hypothetical protein
MARFVDPICMHQRDLVALPELAEQICEDDAAAVIVARDLPADEEHARSGCSNDTPGRS